jgi:hypothetical protein
MGRYFENLVEGGLSIDWILIVTGANVYCAGLSTYLALELDNQYLGMSAGFQATVVAYNLWRHCSDFRTTQTTQDAPAVREQAYLQAPVSPQGNL